MVQAICGLVESKIQSRLLDWWIYECKKIMPRSRPLLTKTMLKILARHASGLTLKEVASEQYISYSAVTNAMYDARQRMEVGSLAGLVMRAHALGYLSHPTGTEQRVFPTQPTDL